MLVASRGHVRRRGHLRHADAEDAPRRARRSRPHTDEDAGDAGFHQLERGVVLDAVADDDRDLAGPHQRIECELVIRARRVSSRQHRALDDEHVRTGLLDDLRPLFGPGRDGGNSAGHTRRLDRLDPLADELRLHRLAIGLFEHRVHRGFVGLCDLHDDGSGILVARVHAVEVEHRHSAQLAHRDREIDVDDTVHRRTPKRKRKTEALAHREGDVDLVGIARHAARHESDLVEAIRAPRPPPNPYLEARLLPGNCFSGFDPALIQGVFTPLEWGGFGEL